MKRKEIQIRTEAQILSRSGVWNEESIDKENALMYQSD